MSIDQVVAIPSIEFTGGIENGAEVVSWISINGGNAEWLERQSGLKGFPDLPEHICITKGRSRSYLWIGNVILKDELLGFVTKTMNKVVVK